MWVEMTTGTAFFLYLPIDNQMYILVFCVKRIANDLYKFWLGQLKEVQHYEKKAQQEKLCACMHLVYPEGDRQLPPIPPTAPGRVPRRATKSAGVWPMVKQDPTLILR